MSDSNSMDYDPRGWPVSFYEENNRPHCNVWNHARPVYQLTGREERPTSSHEGDNWRPHYGRGGPLVPMVDEVSRRSAPAGADPFWTQSSSVGPYRNRNNHTDRPPKRITVELWVPLCCDKCARKVKQHLEEMEGAETVKTDQWTRKVTVTGDVRPDFVLRVARRHKPESTFWSSRSS